MKMIKQFDDMTTDEMLEYLPDNLHVARNDNARKDDRWRIYNRATNKYLEPGFSAVHELLIYTCNKLTEQYRGEDDAFLQSD